MFIINRKLLLYGLVIWAGATLALRFVGQYMLHPGSGLATLMLFAISFPGMALLARWLCGKFEPRREQWLSGAVSLALPTLLLDPFTSAFFAYSYPNMPPEVAGLFGGWMLWCCAGVVAGVMGRGPTRQ